MREKSIIAVKSGSEAGFGYVFSIVFLLIGLYPLLHGGSARIWSLLISGLLLIIALLRPAILARPNYLWFRFGLLLGLIVAPVIMLLVYLLVFVPIGLIMKIAGKDPLQRKFDKARSSYWVEREAPLQPLKNQF